MTKIDTTCEHLKLRLIAAAIGLQKCTGTASYMIPLPGTKRYVLIGDQAALTELLELKQPVNLPDPAPLALRTLGGLMSNVLYQLEQRPGDLLAATADDLRKRWDEAVRVDKQAALQQLADAGQQIEAPAADTFAVNFIEQRAAQYLQDHADTEPCTSAVVFQYGEAGREYHSMLVDLAEDLRQAQRQPEAKPAACTVPPTGWYCMRAAGHEGPCAAYPVAPAAAEHDHSEGGHRD